ncbi:hypothetical protein CC2G_003400 [Coprinopsis cinerea AmutBmut pab1-1]|nr:hypothetical protein CC2G_003400 [Coprinopsis cinerea AmutBmut pab1-1]
MTTAVDGSSIRLDALFTRNASSLAALVQVICEYLLNLEDEIRYIWRWPLNRVRAIYFVARYLGLFGLLANVILLFYGPLATIPNDANDCRTWFAVYSAVSCLVLFSVDAIAMLRVYALYNQSPKVGALFSSLLLTEATLVTTCSSTTLKIVPFSPICDVEKTPYQVIYFACGVVVTQLALMLFTFHKRKVMAGQLHIPILKLVFREGAWISSLTCCIFFFTVPYSLITGTAKPHLVLIWPTTLLSNVASRVILSLHRLPAAGRSLRNPDGAPSAQGTDTDIQFTSYFMNESTDFHVGASDYYPDAFFTTRSLANTASLSSLSLGRPSSSSSTISSLASGLLLRKDTRLDAIPSSPDTR